MSGVNRLYNESRVAEKLQLPRDTIRYIRAEVLKKNDWLQNGRDIVLTQGGLSAVIEHVGVARIEDFADCAVDSEKKEPVELIVTRVPPNRVVLYASLPRVDGIQAREVPVRVKDNSNFRVGMKLTAIAPTPGATGSAALYQLEGRCPRFAGRY
jgi:hypothetical protein